MKRMRIVLGLALFMVLPLFAVPALADWEWDEPYTFGFTRITNNSSVGAALADYFFVSLAPVSGNTTVEFRFRNRIESTGDKPAITAIYFYDTSGSGSTAPSTLFDHTTIQIVNHAGVNYIPSNDNNPKCPGYGGAGKVKAFVAAEPVSPQPQNGVGPGERVDIVFDLINNHTVEDVVAAMDSLDDGTQELQICFHVQGIDPGDQSESYVTIKGPTAIELSAFSASMVDGEVVLNWQTAAEIDNIGFNLYRAQIPTGSPEQINQDGIIAARGSLYAGADYTFIDPDGDKHALYYLVDLDADGTQTWHGPTGVQAPQEPAILFDQRLFLPCTQK